MAARSTPPPVPGRPPGDDTLAEAARRGDLRAWFEITRRHQEVVFRTAYLVTRNSTSAEETTRAAFLRGYRSIGSLEPGAALAPWLMGIAASIARTQSRQLAQRRDAKLPDPDPGPRVPVSPVYLDPAVARPTPHEQAALREAFDRLSDEDRIILISRYGFGLPRDETALRLGIPPSDIQARLTAALARLRAILAEAIERERAMARSGVRPAERTDRLLALDVDQLGDITVATVKLELAWMPDVAAVICDQLAREAVAYSDVQTTVTGPARTGAAPQASPRPGPRDRGVGAVTMVVAAVLVFAILIGMSVVMDPTEAEPSPAGATARQATEAEPTDAEPTAAQADPTLRLVVLGPTAAPTAEQTAAPTAAPPAEPAVSIVGAKTLDDGSMAARVHVAWPHDSGDPVATATLERKIGKGGWKQVATAQADEALATVLRPGKAYQIRVRAQDADGATVLSPAMLVELAVHGPGSDGLDLDAAQWETRRGNVIKERLIALSPDASLRTAFNGSGVALIGPTGPTRGAIGVRVDGGPWTLDDLRVREDSGRTVVFSQDLEPGDHWLDLRAEADGVGVDAVMIVRTMPT